MYFGTSRVLPQTQSGVISDFSYARFLSLAVNFDSTSPVCNAWICHAVGSTLTQLLSRPTPCSTAFMQQTDQKRT
jgi:hypothetical protein